MSRVTSELSTARATYPNWLERYRGLHRAIGRAAAAVFFLAAGVMHSWAGEALEIESDRWETVFAEGRERTVLTGNARVRSDRFTVSADQIELFGDNFRYVQTSGNISMTDEERGLFVTGDRVFLDRDRELIRVEGNAEMEDRENELVVRGGFLENRGEDELAIVQVGVRILREDLVARAEFARYLRAEDVLELSGLPVVFWQDDEYRAARIVIDLSTDEIVLQGDVRGVIRSGEDEEPDTPEEFEADRGVE